jgi:PAP_fibrillin
MTIVSCLLIALFLVVSLVIQHDSTKVQVMAFVVPKLHRSNGGLVSSSPITTATTTRKTTLQVGFFQDLFTSNKPAENAKLSSNNKRRLLNKFQQEQIIELKRSIVLTCDTQPVNRQQLESYIDELATLSPILKPAVSVELRKKWIVLYTTEKEINFFLDNRLANSVDQSISLDGTTISNCIPFTFINGGGLFVDGTLSPEEEEDDDDSTLSGIRTNFQFTSATLDLGLFKLNVPPIGQGWFDTVYLDDDFRIDRNSRNDILIAFPVDE